jgi:hypothetical protein
LAAREGIRARQFMIEGPQRESTIGQMNGIQLKNEFNRILGELSQADNKVRSAVVQRNQGILLEMENNNGAAWMRMTDNCTALCEVIGNNAYFRTRTYNLIAFNVDLMVEPENQVHRDEISKANHLEIGSIMSMRWVKQPERRALGQKTAHLFLSFTNANTANRAISEGLMVCNRKVHIEKAKRDPI